MTDVGLLYSFKAVRNPALKLKISVENLFRSKTAAKSRLGT